MTGLLGMGIDPAAAEQAVLAELMLAPERVADVTRWLSADDFDSPVHRRMFEVICEQRTDGTPASPLTVAAALVDDADRRAYERAVAHTAARPPQLAGDDLLDRMDRVRHERERAYLISRAHLAVVDVLDGPPVDPVVAGRVVLDASVQRQLEGVGEQVARIGRDGLGEPGELVGRAVVRLDEVMRGLEEVRGRVADADVAVDRMGEGVWEQRETMAGDDGW